MVPTLTATKYVVLDSQNSHNPECSIKEYCYAYMCISKYMSSESLLSRFLPSTPINGGAWTVDLRPYNPALYTLHHWIRQNSFAVSNIWHYIQTTLCKNKNCVVLPLMFFSWRPIKNVSGTPYVFFSWQPIKKDSVFLHNDSVTPYVLFDDNQ